MNSPTSACSAPASSRAGRRALALPDLALSSGARAFTRVDTGAHCHAGRCRPEARPEAALVQHGIGGPSDTHDEGDDRFPAATRLLAGISREPRRPYLDQLAQLPGPVRAAVVPVVPSECSFAAQWGRRSGFVVCPARAFEQADDINRSSAPRRKRNCGSIADQYMYNGDTHGQRYPCGTALARPERATGAPLERPCSA